MPTNRTNLTVMSDTHPDDHNDVNAAANDLQAQIDAIIAGGGAAIPESIVDAKGDLIAATANNNVTRLPVGTNGQILAADSAQATGLNWKDGTILIEAIDLSSITGFVGIPGDYTNLRLIGYAAHNNASTTNAHRPLFIRFNGDPGNNYDALTVSVDAAGTQSVQADTATSGVTCGTIGDVISSFTIDIIQYSIGSAPRIHGQGLSRVSTTPTTTSWRLWTGGGNWRTGGPVTQINFAVGSGDTINLGLVSLYGMG